MPFRYLLSGGASIRNLLPALMAHPLTFLESSMSPDRMKKTALFAIVLLEKSGDYKE